MAAFLKPMPRSFLKITEKFRPGHPPIFEGDPSGEDIAEARALFLALDPESQAWYRRGSHLFGDL